MSLFFRSSTRKTNARKQLHRTLGLDRLEARSLMAGDVTVASFLSSAPADPSAEAGKNLAEVYYAELQNTDVSADGVWGKASYEGKTRALEATGGTAVQDDTSKGKLFAKASGDASLIKTQHKAAYSVPAAKVGDQEIFGVKTTAGATAAVGVEGSAEAGVNWNSTKAGGKVEAKTFAGAQVKGDAGIETRVLDIKANASADGFARAGAEASTELTLRADEGLEAKAGAFAGAKAGGTAKAGFGGIDLTVEGEAWAGAGAEGGVTFKKQDDGKIRFHADAGLSPIVGGKTGFGVEVDPEEVQKFGGLPEKVKALDQAAKEDESLQAFDKAVTTWGIETKDSIVEAKDVVFTEVGGGFDAVSEAFSSWF